MSRVNDILNNSIKAATAFRQLNQDQTDHIVEAVFHAAFENRVKLAKQAHEETFIGVWEHKVIKNVIATQLVYEDIRHERTAGVIAEDRKRRFLGWISPGIHLFSLKYVVASYLFKPKTFDLTTSTNGEVRAIIPSGMFEDLMPLDILPLFLMRALAVDDVEEAEALGVLELDEEDLALCAFAVPPSRNLVPCCAGT